MEKADLFIQGGMVFSMVEGESPQPASIAVRDGRIAAILPSGATVEAKETVDAAGCYVTPGFVDSHMHDEYFADPDTVQQGLIRQDVTTAVAGHCGSGPELARSIAARPAPWLHLSYMVGNCALREAVGKTDRYTAVTPEEIETMTILLRASLDRGAMGLSLGLEYAPGASYEELSALANVVAAYPDRLVSVHIRYDDARCVDATREVVRLARENGIRLQVSHLGSMSMGYTQKCIDVINAAVAEGLDVGLDCYPYDAFCAKAGSAVYDDSFVERWNKWPECLEAASGRFKGQRLTFESLAVMRREEPTGLIIAHVMEKEEIDNCLAHPRCIVASDALYTGGGAHPRLTGTFPRALGVLRGKGYSWWDALEKMTTMPADRMRLPAGRIREGATADLVVFDPAAFKDNATFHDPFLPPDGVRMVIVGSAVVLRDGVFAEKPHGDFFLRK